jgi:hypothetical protein
MNSWIISGALAAGALFGIPSGAMAAQDASALLGTWEATVVGKAFRVTFRADGTGLVQGDPVRWTESEGQVTTTDERGKSQVYAFRVEGSRLTLSGADLGGSLSFVRKATDSGTAQPTGDSGLAGTWENRGPASPIRLTLLANQSGTLNGVPLKWAASEGALVLSVPSSGVTRKWKAALAGDTLTLSGEGLPEAVTFSRVVAAGPDRRLLGTWQSTTGALFQFKDEQTVVNANGTFRYSASGGILSLRAGSAVFSATYEIIGDRLILGDGGAQKIEFTRAAGLDAKPASSSAGPREVIVNGTRLSDETVAQLERAFRVRILDGRYWYDRLCGAWGLDGGPTAGLIPAGLDLGGPLKANASRGNTGVVVNGRELPIEDVLQLQQVTVVAQGRYWLDAAGNVGYEGRPGAILNLVQLSRARFGGVYHSRNPLTGIGSGGNGETSYVMGKDWSVIIGK